MTLFEKTEKAFVRFSAFIAIGGGMGLLFATLVTCFSIVLKLVRRALDHAIDFAPTQMPWVLIRPIFGEEELVTYGVALALFAALPWAMIQKGHIRINLFEDAFSGRVNRLLDLICDMVLAAIAYLILTRQFFLIFRKARRSENPFFSELFAGNFETLIERLRDSQESQILAIPLWPTYIIAELLVAIFFIVAMFCVLRSARALFIGALT